MAIPQSGNLRRHCNNLRRMIDDIEVEIGNLYERIRQTEEDVNGLEKELSDPDIQSWRRIEIINKLRQLYADLSIYKDEVQKLRRKRDDTENHFMIDCDAF